MNRTFILLLLLFWTSVSSVVNSSAAEATGHIQLQQINGRSWLVDAQGQPFFAHGITHIGTTNHGIPYTKVAKACKAIGFNAYGRSTALRVTRPRHQM